MARSKFRLSATGSKSVTRQLEHARAYAAAKGWTIPDELVFIDDGISGALFGAARPALARLLNALEPRPTFRALIVSEESRLGREQIETAYLLKQITDAGVEVHCYLTRQRRSMETALDKVMLGLTNFASEMERERARQRTYDAMMRKAKAGQVTGGVVFGYRNVDVVGPDGKRAHVLRRIDDAEAKVVRRAFELYAQGLGLKRIADRLNREGAAAPLPRRKGRPRGWATSTLRAMLRRELYVGRIVWGKSQNLVRKGAATSRRRDASEWLTREAPELRIVEDDTWTKVQVRLGEAAEAFPRTEDGGHLLGRPRAHDSRYLLTGFAICRECGGSIGTITRQHGTGKVRRPVHHYGCQVQTRRGTGVCSNRALIRQDVFDRALLDALLAVLEDRVTVAAIDAAIERLQAGAARLDSRRTEIERELSLLEGRIHRAVNAIADGVGVATELAALVQQDKRRTTELTAELVDLDHAASKRLDVARARKEITSRAADMRGVLERNTTQARQVLRKLLVGPLVLEPALVPGARRAYRFSGKLALSRLLGYASEPGAETRESVVAPTGFEPVFQP